MFLLQILLIAGQYNLPTYDTVLHFVNGHLPKLLPGDDLIQLSKSSILDMLSDPTLSYVKSEDFFHFIVRCGQFMCCAVGYSVLSDVLLLSTHLRCVRPAFWRHTDTLYVRLSVIGVCESPMQYFLAAGAHLIPPLHHRVHKGQSHSPM